MTLPQVTLEKLQTAGERALLEKPRGESQAFSLLGKGQEPGTQGRHPNQGQGLGFPSPGHPPPCSVTWHEPLVLLCETRDLDEILREGPPQADSLSQAGA